MASDTNLSVTQQTEHWGAEPYDPSVEAEVLAYFARYSKAHIDTDIPALEALLAEDYQHFHASGRIDDKQSLLARLGSGAVKHVQKESSFVTVKVYGLTAILSGQGRHTVIIDGRTKLVENLFTTVWVRSAASRWRITNWTAVPVTALSHFPSDPPSSTSDRYKTTES